MKLTGSIRKYLTDSIVSAHSNDFDRQIDSFSKLLEYSDEALIASGIGLILQKLNNLEKALEEYL